MYKQCMLGYAAAGGEAMARKYRQKEKEMLALCCHPGLVACCSMFAWCSHPQRRKSVKFVLA